jgi:ADP-ribosyl-[dinitrogen reductase] hydrolase
MKDRCRGALMGLAVGDALGAAVEFSSPGSFAPVTGYRSGGPHGLKAGEWTDDTSMALALADSMASVGWDLNDQAERYVQWRKHGKYSVNGRCFDVGITTSRALHKFIESRDASPSGSRSESASGNGSIMRLAPVPIRYAGHYPDNIEELSRLADESSLPTHASEQCRSACRYLATVLAALVRGEDRAAVLSPDWKPLQILNDIKPLRKWQMCPVIARRFVRWPGKSESRMVEARRDGDRIGEDCPFCPFWKGKQGSRAMDA